MKETYKLIQKIAKEFNVPEKEVQIGIGEKGFLSFWQYIETGIEKQDKWKLLEVKKI